jgi:hypothetical protein
MVHTDSCDECGESLNLQDPRLSEENIAHGYRLFTDSEGKISLASKFYLNGNGNRLYLCSSCENNPALQQYYEAMDKAYHVEQSARTAARYRAWEVEQDAMPHRRLKNAGANVMTIVLFLGAAIGFIAFLYFILHNSPMPGNNP